MRALLVGFALASLAACGPTSPADDNDQLDTPVGKADAASVPGGAYTNAAPGVGELATLSLDSDHRFTLAKPVECVRAPCDAEVETGRFLLTHSTNSNKRYIRLYADDNSDLGRYQWKLVSGKLELKSTEDDGATWFEMAKGASCDSAGGSCIALSPGSCAGGSVGDATEYSCGGGLGVECCLPAQTASCSADSDCTGLVPQFCRTCADGSEACAHWTCLDNSCAVVSCD